MNARFNLFGISLALLFIFISCTRDINKTESFRDIFDYYRDQEGVTAFSIPPSLIGLILSRSDESENELASMMKDLSVFKMILLEESIENQGIKDNMYNVINGFTLRNGFNDFFIIRSSEENMIIRVKESKEIISEAIIMFLGEEGFTVINLRGNINPENIAKLLNSGVIQDIEALYTR